MIDLVFFTVAALTLTAAIAKTRTRRRHPGQPALTWLCLLLYTLAAAFTFLAPASQHLENTIYPNLGRLLSNLSTMTAALAILAMLLHIAHPPPAARRRIRPRLAILAAALTAMTALFVLTSMPSLIGSFGSLYRSSPTLVAYIAIYVLFLGAALIDLLTLALRCARHATGRPYLRAGLNTLAGGCLLGLAYLAEKALHVAGQALAVPQIALPHGTPCTTLVTPPGCAFSVTMPAAAVLLIVIGTTLPTWAPILHTPRRWLHRRRTHTKLRPLWAALSHAIPEINLAAASHQPLTDIGYRLHRRVIEIRDGMLLLRPHLDPDIYTAAAEQARAQDLPAHTIDAVGQAAQIAAALAARQAGHPPRQHPVPQPDHSTGRPPLGQGNELDTHTAHPDARNRPPASTPGSDLDSEAAHLAEIADAFAGCPIVAPHHHPAPATTHPTSTP